MIITISIIIITAACFLVAVTCLAAEQKYRIRLTSAAFAIAVVLGITLYGCAYYDRTSSIATAVLCTITSVCRMFCGDNDMEIIAEASMFEKNWVVIVFWAVHVMAFYATAGAVSAAIGSRVLNRIRISLLKRGTLLLIYGINANSVEYGKRQIRQPGHSVVFVGQGDESLEEAITAAGGVVEKNGEHPDNTLLRRWGIRPGKRRIEIVALHEDGEANFAFVQELLEAFDKAKIHSEQTRLVLRAVDEDQAASLVAVDDRYGYGSVMAFDERELAARLMVHMLPPCDTIHFDNNARATEDFNVLMIGFGRMGRAALDALVMNGQFSGSCFRADIFDVNAQNGVLHDHEILRKYDIRFHAYSGNSDEFYAFLDERRNFIRYIVICTGNTKENREIAWDIGHWLKKRGAAPAIVQCSGQDLVFTRPGESKSVYQTVYGSDALDIERIDMMAMAINHAYCRGSEKTPGENWKHCDYFSRMSSRASADFYPAVLRGAGKTIAQVENGDWPPCGEALENLAISEHMRWCAFHYVMGFRTMSETEFAQRAGQYQAEVRAKGVSSLRITKDITDRKHACLIPWEELDALSDRENAVTGGQVDYKQMDRNNILVLPDILAVLREMQPKHEE